MYSVYQNGFLSTIGRIQDLILRGRDVVNGGAVVYIHVYERFQPVKIYDVVRFAASNIWCSTMILF